MVVGSIVKGCDVVVIGGGPGGYVAALRLARMGKDVLLIESSPRLGGICLNEGCIPSKALIHAADLVFEMRHGDAMGITTGEIHVDMKKLRSWKDRIVENLTGGVGFLCRKAGVEVLRGHARFVDTSHIECTTEDGPVEVEFRQAVIATGSSPDHLKGIETDGKRIIGPREALDLEEIPDRMVVIGAGYIGLELGTVYAKLGTKVDIVEFLPTLFPAMEPEVGKTLRRSLKKLHIGLHLDHAAESIERIPAGVRLHARKGERTVDFDADLVLLAVGRRPNSSGIGLEALEIETDEKGFIRVDDKMRTSREGIYAIGDVVGGVLLAHKAYYEAKIAADIICGNTAAFDTTAIPAVVYTDPEIAVVGMTEAGAGEAGHQVRTGTFSLKASGRAMTLGATDGFIKTVIDGESGLLLGMTAVGRGVSELISEATLALEMSAFAEDLALTIHPHPSLSEAVQEAVEAALGRAVHQA